VVEVGEQRERIHDVLRALTAHPRRRDLILRGGFLSQHWLGEVTRGYEDLDFLATPALDLEAVGALAWELLDPQNPLERELTTIWEESDSPGQRLWAWFGIGHGEFQIDIATGDPLALPLQTLELGPDISVLTPAPEEMFAWKLHGLFEFEDHRWRNKDLQDLYLYVRHLELDPDALCQSIPLAFQSRDQSPSVVDRLLEGQLGRSSGSRRHWRQYRKAQPKIPVPEDPAEAAEVVAEYLRPVMARVREQGASGNS